MDQGWISTMVLLLNITLPAVPAAFLLALHLLNRGRECQCEVQVARGSSARI
jgi:hypothetical protein